MVGEKDVKKRDNANDKKCVKRIKRNMFISLIRPISLTVYILRETCFCLELGRRNKRK